MVSSGHPSSHPQVLAVTLPDRPLMPGLIMPVVVHDEALIAAIREMKQRGQAYVGAFLKKSETNADREASSGGAAAAATTTVDDDVDSVDWDPSDDMHDMGTFAQVQRIATIDEKFGPKIVDGGEGEDEGGAGGGGPVTLLLVGHRRLRKSHTVRSVPRVVRVEHLKDPKRYNDDDVMKATSNEVLATLKELLNYNPLTKEILHYYAHRFSDLQDPAKLADLAASMCSVDGAALQEILETLDVPDRLGAALMMLKKEVELAKLQVAIGKRVEEKISKDQRRYFLMEQLKSVKKELGMERDDKTALAQKFQEKFAPFKAQAPAHAVRVIEEELQKLAGLEPSSSEFNVTRNYLDWLTSIPWGHSSQERLDITEASKVLDADHYGLEDVKERILEVRGGKGGAGGGRRREGAGGSNPHDDSTS